MLSRSAIARVVLLAAAAASVATTNYDGVFDSSLRVYEPGPHLVVLRGSVMRATLFVRVTGDATAFHPTLELDIDATAGREPGNPELTVRLIDAATGDELAVGSDRQPFQVAAELPCDDGASCTHTWIAEFELAHGAEADVTWDATLWWTGPADSAGEPAEVTLDITVP